MNSKLIEKFFRKECTPEEVNQILDWFRLQGIAPLQDVEMRVIWEEAKKEKHYPRFTHNPDEMLKLIHQQMDQRLLPPTPVDSRVPKVRYSGSWAYALRVAAIIFFPVLFIWLLQPKADAVEKVIPPKVLTVETPAGTKLTKTLPDGSKVILNARSAIAYASDYGAENREITLTGEAFFEVVKDSLRPFIIHSGNLSTTALGTAFNIIYRPDEAVTKVSLVTGMVRVTTEDTTNVRQVTNLRPGEQLNYDKHAGSFHTDHFDTLEALAWKDNILYFSKSGIKQVVRQLEDWYGVSIQLTGNTSKAENQYWTYTGMFKNQNLENVLTGISYVKDFSFEIKEKNVKLIFN